MFAKSLSVSQIEGQCFNGILNHVFEKAENIALKAHLQFPERTLKINRI